MRAQYTIFNKVNSVSSDVLFEGNGLRKLAISSCLILIALACIISVEPVKAAITTVSVDPTNLNLSTAYVGQTIQVNINVTNVQDMWGWSLQNIRFNPNVLNITGVNEGPFLKNHGDTFFLWTSESELAFSKGDIPNINDALAENSTVNGSGVLATLTFKVIASGSSPIILNTTQLFNNHEYTPHETETGINQQISCTTVNGNIVISQILPGSPPPSTPSANTATGTGSNVNNNSNVIFYGIALAVIVCALVTAVVVKRTSVAKRRKRTKRR